MGEDGVWVTMGESREYWDKGHVEKPCTVEILRWMSKSQSKQWLLPNTKLTDWLL